MVPRYPWPNRDAIYSAARRLAAPRLGCGPSVSMYENWKLKRWDTFMSDTKHLFMESLHDHAGVLEIELADYSNNVAIARYKVTFRRYPAHRNTEESYQVELWQRRDGLSDSGPL